MTGARRPSPLTLAALVVAAVLVLLPLAAESWQVGQLAQYLCYGLFAMSLSLVWGQCGLLCFGQAHSTLDELQGNVLSQLHRVEEQVRAEGQVQGQVRAGEQALAEG